MLNDNTLSARSAELHNLISHSEFTDAEGHSLDACAGIRQALDILRATRAKSASVYLVGNGGSSAVASHIHVDFLNVAGLRASTLHEPSLLTCMTNDYGYENAYSQILSRLAKTDDVLIAISSSGRSKNILNAAASLKEAGGTVITFSGFDPNNPLRKLGHLNVWLNAHKYGLVEIGHLFLLHHLVDCFSEENKNHADNEK